MTTIVVGRLRRWTTQPERRPSATVHGSSVMHVTLTATRRPSIRRVVTVCASRAMRQRALRSNCQMEYRGRRSPREP